MATKENDGTTACNRRWKHIRRLCYFMFCSLVVYLLLNYDLITKSRQDVHYYTTNNNGGNVKTKRHNQHYNKKQGRRGERIRFQREEEEQRERVGDNTVSLTSEDTTTTIFEGIPLNILNGYLNLIDIYVDTNALSKYYDNKRNKNSLDLDEQEDYHYIGVYGTFCRLDWELHKNDPSSYPMFRFLVSQSKLCDETTISNISIHQLVRALRRYDTMNQNSTVATADAAVVITGTNVLQVGGFVFHESRCGSTLVSNLLVASDPKRHRVYSESGPPVSGLQACGIDYEYCSVEVAASIFRDVIYLMSRSDDPTETTVFFKIQSIGSRNILTFHAAYSYENTENRSDNNDNEKAVVSYIFVYREPVQVMMSQLQHGVKNSNCVRPQRRTTTAKIVHEIVRKYVKTLDNNNDNNHMEQLPHPSLLKPEEYCAVHLATITESILQHFMIPNDRKNDNTIKQMGQLTHNNNGIVVNYSTLPDSLYDHIFPNHFHIMITTESLERMRSTALKYSKGFKKESKKNKLMFGHTIDTTTTSFQSDSENKVQAANEQIKSAAKQFLYPSYERLQQLTTIT